MRLLAYFFAAGLGLLLNVTAAHAQVPTALPIERAADFGFTIQGLDARHAPAVDNDPAQAVFGDNPEAVVTAWQALLTDLSTHLQAEGFTWTDPLRSYHRFYFGPDGRIERVLYKLYGADEERVAHYGRLLDTFAQGYAIALQADEPFRQCSPVTLMPPSN